MASRLLRYFAGDAAVEKGCLYRVYYPIHGTMKLRKGRWFPSPFHVYTEGLSRFLKLPLWFTRYALMIVRGVRGSWHERSDGEEDIPVAPERKFPLVLFSHGLGGTSTMYSTLCCEIASHGFVVCALEHDDCTACATLDQNNDPIWFLRPNKELIGTDQGYSWRHSQQRKRVSQLLALKRELLTSDAWGCHLDEKSVAVMGHSFGGASAVATAAQARGDIRCCVVLDGWMWPIVGGDDDDIGHIQHDFGPIQTPTLFLDAETYFNDLRWRSAKVDVCRRAGERPASLAYHSPRCARLC